MELHAHLHLIKLSVLCPAENTPKGMGAPDKRPGYPGRRLWKALFVSYIVLDHGSG